MYTAVFDFSVRDENYLIQEGVIHLCDPTTAKLLATTYGGNVCVSSYQHLITQTPTSILVIRHGAFGDLLMLTPTIRALSARNTPIVVAASGKYRTALFANPYVASFSEYPPLLSKFAQAQILSFEDIDVELERRHHLVDLFAREASITLDSHELEMHVAPESQLAAAALLRPYRAALPLIGIQIHASNQVRSYPLQRFQELLQLLTPSYQCLLFSQDNKYEALDGTNTIFAHRLTTRTDFQLCAAMIAMCDVFIGPDSAFTHVATALKIPLIALYGPFPSRLRLRASPQTKAFDGQAPCAPCFHHTRGNAKWPIGQPCTTLDRCIALDNIAPTEILRHVNQLLPPSSTLPSA